MFLYIIIPGWCQIGRRAKNEKKRVKKLTFFPVPGNVFPLKNDRECRSIKGSASSGRGFGFTLASNLLNILR
jgi:hypothetical protein